MLLAGCFTFAFGRWVVACWWRGRCNWACARLAALARGGDEVVRNGGDDGVHGGTGVTVDRVGEGVVGGDVDDFCGGGSFSFFVDIRDWEGPLNGTKAGASGFQAWAGS